MRSKHNIKTCLHRIYIFQYTHYYLLEMLLTYADRHFTQCHCRFFLQICLIRGSKKWFFFRITYPQNMHVVEMSINKIYRCLFRCGSIPSFTQILIKLVGRLDNRDNRKCSIHHEVLSENKKIFDRYLKFSSWWNKLYICYRFKINHENDLKWYD